MPNVPHHAKLVLEQLHFAYLVNHQIRDRLVQMLVLVLMVLLMLAPLYVVHAITLVRLVWHLVTHAQLVRSML